MKTLKTITKGIAWLLFMICVYVQSYLYAEENVKYVNVSGISISPERVVVGQNADISIKIKNDDSRPRNYKLKVRIKEGLEGSQQELVFKESYEGAVNAGSTEVQRINFVPKKEIDHALDTSIEYEKYDDEIASSGWQSRSWEYGDRKQATLKVGTAFTDRVRDIIDDPGSVMDEKAEISEITLTPERAQSGQKVSIKVKLQNKSKENTDYRILVNIWDGTIAGNLVYEKEKTGDLAKGDSKWREFEFTPIKEKNHKLKVYLYKYTSANKQIEVDEKGETIRVGEAFIDKVKEALDDPSSILEKSIGVTVINQSPARGSLGNEVEVKFKVENKDKKIPGYTLKAELYDAIAVVGNKVTAQEFTGSIREGEHKWHSLKFTPRKNRDHILELNLFSDGGERQETKSKIIKIGESFEDKAARAVDNTKETAEEVAESDKAAKVRVKAISGKKGSAKTKLRWVEGKQSPIWVEVKNTGVEGTSSKTTKVRIQLIRKSDSKVLKDSKEGVKVKGWGKTKWVEFSYTPKQGDAGNVKVNAWIEKSGKRSGDKEKRDGFIRKNIDMAVTGIFVDQTDIKQGDTVNIRVNVKNNSKHKSIKREVRIKAGDEKIYLKKHIFKAGEKKEFTVLWKAGYPGAYAVNAVVKPLPKDGERRETSRKNNYRSKQITVDASADTSLSLGSASAEDMREMFFKASELLKDILLNGRSLLDGEVLTLSPEEFITRPVEISLILDEELAEEFLTDYEELFKDSGEETDEEDAAEESDDEAEAEEEGPDESVGVEDTEDYIEGSETGSDIKNISFSIDGGQSWFEMKRRDTNIFSLSISLLDSELIQKTVNSFAASAEPGVNKLPVDMSIKVTLNSGDSKEFKPGVLLQYLQGDPSDLIENLIKLLKDRYEMKDKNGLITLLSLDFPGRMELIEAIQKDFFNIINTRLFFRIDNIEFNSSYTEATADILWDRKFSSRTGLRYDDESEMSINFKKDANGWKIMAFRNNEIFGSSLLSLPDLRVNPADIGLAFSAGNLIVSAVVKNIGTGPAESFNVAYQYSIGSTVRDGLLEVPFIAAGSQETVEYVFENIPFSAPAGVSIKITLDPENRVFKSKNSDSGINKDFSLTFPDLTTDASGMSVTLSSLDIVVSADISNKGSAASGDFILDFTYSQSGNVLKASENVSSIAPNTARTVTHIFSNPGFIPAIGASLLVALDPDNNVSESNEDNNTATESFPF